VDFVFNGIESIGSITSSQTTRPAPSTPPLQLPRVSSVTAP
jgi:hypothetical protein